MIFGVMLFDLNIVSFSHFKIYFEAYGMKTTST